MFLDIFRTTKERPDRWKLYVCEDFTIFKISQECY